MTRRQEIVAFFNDPNRVTITVPLTKEVKEKIKVLARRYVKARIHAPPTPRYQRPKLACETGDKDAWRAVDFRGTAERVDGAILPYDTNRAAR